MKILSFFILSLIMLSDVTGQHFNIGAKAGLNLYNINSDDAADYETKAGLHLGLLGHLHLTRQYGLQLEALYSSQGARYSFAGNEYDLNLSYINVPILFQYMFNYGFRIQAGPQVGILVDAESDNAGNGDIDVSDDFKSAEVALSLGASYVHVSSGFGVDARYNIGLSDITKTSITDITNSGLQLGLFYLFIHK